MTRRDAEGLSPSGRRVKVSLNAGWLFEKQSRGIGELGSYERRRGRESETERIFVGAEQLEYDDSCWERVDIPHCWNAHDVMTAQSGYWRGIGWYRKTFRLGEQWSEKRVRLQFEGVNQRVTLWLNGRVLGSHKGGYTPFEFDITEHLNPLGEVNILAARVDNLYDPDMPPTVKTDINFVGGIYRDVRLEGTYPIHVSSVWVQSSKLDHKKAVIVAKTVVANNSSATRVVQVLHKVFDGDGNAVCSFSGEHELVANELGEFEHRLQTVSNPRLWSPESPHLYRLLTQV
ncbi:MAG TPA: beta galactosidase jelly roll domain-containing protein, partial [bacterium]|nr:beta galactosidase jelly roll domain-containing protein [bacterium]